MRSRKVWLKTGVMAGLFLLLCGSVYSAAPGFHVIKKIQLGGEGGWDDLTVDSVNRKLYVSRSSYVMVIELNSGKLAGIIPDTPGVHAIAVAPELNRGFTSNGRTNSSTIFDLKTLKPLGQVRTGANPDALVYDPATKRVFAFNGRGNDATVFEAATGVVISSIPLNGKPEFARADGKGRVFVNIEDKSEVAVIDSRKLQVLNRYSIKPGEEPSGIGLDAEQGIVFSACANNTMAILDAKAGVIISTVAVGSGVDGAGYDAGFAFSSNGKDGTLTVVRASPAGKYEAVETVPTQTSARTMTIDPRTHNIYLPAALFGPMPPAPLTGLERQRRRPPMIKDSFVIIVVGVRH